MSWSTFKTSCTTPSNRFEEKRTFARFLIEILVPPIFWFSALWMPHALTTPRFGLKKNGLYEKTDQHMDICGTTFSEWVYMEMAQSEIFL